MIILILFTLIYALIRAIYFVYLFQIKEYRFDRLSSHIREYGFYKIFYLSRNRLPAFSIRNILLILLVSISLGLIFLIALEKKVIYNTLLFLLPLAPLLSFLLTSLAVMLTEIPSRISRYFIITQAMVKVKNSSAQFIGITGTYGKTSVKEYVAYLLSASYKVAKTEKNMNTDVGIALAINKNLTPTTDIFVTEVGSYRLGETKQATWYIPFKYGILTGLGNQHLDLYGSKQNLIKEETSLLYNVMPEGCVYVNSATLHEELNISNIPSKKVTYGFHHSDIRAKILSQQPPITKALISYKGYEFTIETSLPGHHSVLNLLPAIAIAMDYGIKPHDIVLRIKQLQPVEGKLSTHQGRVHATILNDSANSNVEGFLAALAILKQYPQKTKYIISPGIIELGVEKRSSYEKIIHELYNSNAKLFTTDALFKELDTKQRVMIFNDVLQLRDKIVSLMNKHTVILLEGKIPDDVKKSIIIR